MAEAKASPKHADIADRLTEEILLGQYRTGERLPSERDLAGRFDANRGAVREAMQRLQQLGIVHIQPGGARVAPVDEASLDVIGHLLALGELPEASLVDQIMSTVTSLITLAAETAARSANDVDFARIQALVEPLTDPELTGLPHTEARIALLQVIMETSGNLPCQLIARSLLMQLAPRLAVIEPYLEMDYHSYRQLTLKLKDALAARDVIGVRNALETMAELNQENIQRALETAAQHIQGSGPNASSSKST